MSSAKSRLAFVVFAFAVSSCTARPEQTLRERLEARISESRADVVGVYFHDLETSDSLLINSDVRMHAASTMKVPVMIQLFQDADNGLLELDQPVPVKQMFTSIVDGSSYLLDMESDSDSLVYEWVGREMPLIELVDRMITVSSNLATNIVIEQADAKRVTDTMRQLGADSIEVLRGVEDLKAFEARLSNTTTARDLGVIFLSLAQGRAASDYSTEKMLAILELQEFNDGIPAGLPQGMRVAHKTGEIAAIHHDAAIVYPEGRAGYVLVVMVRGIEDHDESAELIGDVSRMVYEAVR